MDQTSPQAGSDDFPRHPRASRSGCAHLTSEHGLQKLGYPAAQQEDEWKQPRIDVDWNQLSSLFQNQVNAAKDIITKTQFASSQKWIPALELSGPSAFVAVLLYPLHSLTVATT